MPYPRNVTLVFSQKTIDCANALIRKYQNEKGGVVHVLKVNPAYTLHHSNIRKYGNWNNWLEEPIASVKTVYARHFFLDSLCKVPALEELHISCEDLTCYVFIYQYLPTLTQLRVLGFFNLGNSKHCIVQSLDCLKSISHLKKLCLSFNMSRAALFSEKFDCESACARS